MARTRRKAKAVRKYADRRVVTVAHSKKIFLKWLASGKAPAQAAEKVGVSRATAYNWKRDDAEFDTQWINAVESALDKIETAVIESAIAGDASNAQFMLKWRRRNVYNNVDGDRAHTNITMNITLQEHLQRLERLGLPLPVIESDYEEIVDAPESDRE